MTNVKKKFRVSIRINLIREILKSFEIQPFWFLLASNATNYDTGSGTFGSDISQVTKKITFLNADLFWCRGIHKSSVFWRRIWDRVHIVVIATYSISPIDIGFNTVSLFCSFIRFWPTWRFTELFSNLWRGKPRCSTLFRETPRL